MLLGIFRVKVTILHLYGTLTPGGVVSILLVYVDDIIMTGNDLAEQARLKAILTREFEVKELGRLKYFLGIEVARSKSGIFISQQKYTKDVLQEVGMENC